MTSNQQPGQWANPEPTEIARILRSTKTIAVVGLSTQPDRPSNHIAAYLIEQGYDVIPVNPAETEILGRTCYPDLTSIGRPVDLVDVFRKGEATPPIVREAIAIGAKNIWLQEGVVSQESYDLAVQAGRPIVMDRCILKQHRRLEEEGNGTF
jgi:hypothetical protein